MIIATDPLEPSVACVRRVKLLLNQARHLEYVKWLRVLMNPSVLLEIQITAFDGSKNQKKKCLFHVKLTCTLTFSVPILIFGLLPSIPTLGLVTPVQGYH